tara:strand:+ start:800 stop:1297 length:498 start_codon:yes stop_codon:yes gene_type:complete
MPWKHNNIVIRAGRGWVSDKGIKHPTNWMSWSDEEKKAAGLVWEDDPKPFDSRFWWDATTPRDIHNQKNDDGSVTPGLKTLWKQKTKETAASLLAPTDWYVIRFQEDDTKIIPNNIKTYRAEVRKKSGVIETSIDNASTHAKFMALFDAPEGGVAPIANWPDPVE